MQAQPLGSLPHSKVSPTGVTNSGPPKINWAWLVLMPAYPARPFGCPVRPKLYDGALEPFKRLPSANKSRNLSLGNGGLKR